MFDQNHTSNELCFNNQPRNSLIINKKSKNGCSQAKKNYEREEDTLFTSQIEKGTVLNMKNQEIAHVHQPKLLDSSPTGPRAFAPTSTGPLPGTTLFPADNPALGREHWTIKKKASTWLHQWIMESWEGCFQVWAPAFWDTVSFLVETFNQWNVRCSTVK